MFVVLDNLSNASEKSLERVSKICRQTSEILQSRHLDRDALNEIFDKEDIDSCIHFAGLKAMGNLLPNLEYYENNIAGTLTLVDVMRKHNVKNIIFSSSATVCKEIRQSSRSQKSARKDSAQTHTDGQNPCLSRLDRHSESRSGMERSSSPLL